MGVRNFYGQELKLRLHRSGSDLGAAGPRPGWSNGGDLRSSSSRPGKRAGRLRLGLGRGE